MNVPLPGADDPLTLTIILVTMVIVAISMVGFFRWKKWL
jgi:Mg2+ and Co2+ transporter CorA